MLDTFSFFDRVYSDFARYWWQEETRYSLNPNDYNGINRVLIEIIMQRKKGIALDIGAGEGADAIRLARLGYKVDVIEGSAIALEKIKKYSQDEGVKINNYFLGSIDLFRPECEYDLILCNGVLHYIKNKISVLKKMYVMTKTSGINVVSLFSNYSPVPECHKIIDVYPDSEKGIVFKFYKNWKIIFKNFERNKIEKHHPGFPTHSHSFIKIIAEKK
jgi:2-polyprenyl-3-methyl-5-hydroxy-6-metoxy-1,4-benzoquinol methylase